METTRRQHFNHVDSTQRIALSLARSGAAPGSVVVADRQDDGRGRLDRRWESPEGGLYLSVLLPLPASGATLLPLAMGSALADSLGPYSARPLLKWPNDLLVVDPPRPARKLAGVLVDAVPDAPAGATAVVGVGVNVNSSPVDYPMPLRARVVQLSELAGREVPLDELERTILAALALAADRLATRDGRDETLAECRARLFGRGQGVVVDGRPSGTIEDLDDDGALVICEGNARRHLLAGDVRVEGM
ncbi:MAG TPA: biotin--[acetyl-CoA-carboxylase] ligase [Thermoplasmata archaeon]|nr:biotin--[acetyl-CoA-carboxylase] ligase [Thermoplasmata archaeon]